MALTLPTPQAVVAISAHWETRGTKVTRLETPKVIKKALLDRDEKILLGENKKLKKLWNTAHPTMEHYLPLIYAYGASDISDKTDFIFEGFQMGSLSMRAVRFG